MAAEKSSSRSWMSDAAIYQIYPRSFKDSTGSGLGDIAGITQQMDYLERLGIKAIWLSPFYPSPLVDGGYDVADYCDVDPRLGSLDDFDDMIAAAHARGIKVIVDIVPNHSSNQHPWFKAALAAGPDRPSAPVISSAMVAASMASCLPPIGMPTLAARLDACCGRSMVSAHVYARAAGL